MAFTYTQFIDQSTDKVSENTIKRLPDCAFIPFDPDNTDYQAYLKWIALGNTPEPAANT